MPAPRKRRPTLHADHTVVEARLTQLQAHPENPRTISPDRLAALTRALQAAPDMLRARPLIALTDGTVIAGNQRLQAARDLGWETIPTVYVDLDEPTAKEWALRDNAPYGDWEHEGLADWLTTLQAEGRDLELTGFAPADLSQLLAAAGPDDAERDTEPDTKIGKATTRPGDLITLGNHRLICGDARDPAALAEVAAAWTADMLWTYPPYGVDYEGKTKDALTIAGDTPRALPELLRDAFAATSTVLTPGAALYVAHPAGPLSLLFAQTFVDAGWKLRQTLVWNKGTIVLGHADYHYSHEPILYGNTPAKGRRGRGGKGWYGDNSQASVIDVPKPAHSREHPTSKPVELIERCITNSCPPDGTVLDPFAGSGSTLLACENLGRRCLAVELDPGYCDVIIDRWERHTGQHAQRPAHGK